MVSQVRRAAVVTAVLALTGPFAWAPEDVAHAAPDPCAVIDSCSLGELAARSGIRFGFAFGPSGDADRQALALRHANTYLNHAFSWRTIEPSRGVWNFGPADANAAYADANGLRHEGFHFAWDQEALDDLPDWVLGITDPEELRTVLRDRARTIFDRYPTLAQFDVVNEPIESLGGELYQNHFYDVLGPDYVIELFDIVGDEAPPGTDLTINENLIEYSPAKAEALVSLATSVVEAGLRIDGVGFQSHFLLPATPDWELYRQTMERIAQLGLEVYVTELDAPVAATLPDRFDVQADRYAHAVEACLAVPACEEIFIWGLDDSDTWYDFFLVPGLDPLLFDADLTPKPAFGAVYEALLAGRPEPTATTTTTTLPSAPPPTPPGVSPAFTG